MVNSCWDYPSRSMLPQLYGSRTVLPLLLWPTWPTGEIGRMTSRLCQEDLFQDLGKKWGEYPMKNNLILEISRWTIYCNYYLPDFPYSWLALERFLVWHHMRFFLAEKKLRDVHLFTIIWEVLGMILLDFQEWIQAESSRKFEKWRWQPPLTPSLSKSMDLWPI